MPNKRTIIKVWVYEAIKKNFFSLKTNVALDSSNGI